MIGRTLKKRAAGGFLKPEASTTTLIGYRLLLSRAFSEEVSKQIPLLFPKNSDPLATSWSERKGSPEFYEKVERTVFRHVHPMEKDPHSLNAHPKDRNAMEFRHLMTYGHLSPRQYNREINRQMGIDEYEVVVDPETFRFRDVLKKHFKNINEPIPNEDYFVVMSFYYLMGYLIWITFKQIGYQIRKPYLEAKKRSADKVELKRLEEEKVGSEMVNQSRSPQAFYRYDFGTATKELHNRLDEIDRLLKDPRPHSIRSQPKAS